MHWPLCRCSQNSIGLYGSLHFKHSIHWQASTMYYVILSTLYYWIGISFKFSQYPDVGLSVLPIDVILCLPLDFNSHPNVGIVELLLTPWSPSYSFNFLYIYSIFWFFLCSSFINSAFYFFMSCSLVMFDSNDTTFDFSRFSFFFKLSISDRSTST